MNARRSGSRRSLKSDLARVDAHSVKPAAEYRELPELTDDALARAKIGKGGRKPSSPRLPADVIESARPLPESNEEWLAETAAAYLDAHEAMPFGDLLGEPFGEADLFHLASAVAVKFRGCSRSARLRRQANEAALASYAANLRRHPGVLGDPHLAFAFCYLASHYGLRLLTVKRVEALMAAIERNRKALARLIARGTKSSRRRAEATEWDRLGDDDLTRLFEQGQPLGARVRRARSNVVPITRTKPSSKKRGRRDAGKP